MTLTKLLLQCGTKQPGQIERSAIAVHHNIVTRLPGYPMSDDIPPSAYKHLTDVQVMQCLTLSRNGWTIRAIADEVGCDKSTVERVLQDHDYETVKSRRNSSKRLRKTT